jgi:hypothetical protein
MLLEGDIRWDLLQFEYILKEAVNQQRTQFGQQTNLRRDRSSKGIAKKVHQHL